MAQSRLYVSVRDTGFFQGLRLRFHTFSCFLIAALLLSQQSLAAQLFVADNDLKQASIEIVNQLKFNHYRYISLDNDFSSKLLDRYISELDPQRTYFLKQDILEFEKYRYELDNALNRGDLEPAFTIFARYHERVETRLQWAMAMLAEGVEQFDFSQDEYLEIDREKAPWAESEAELDELWRKRTKNSALSLILAKKEPQEIPETLSKRYKNQLNRLNQTNIDDAFQLYMNIVSQLYDPHTEYFAPRRSENFNINMSLSLEGIGAVLQADQEYTKIVRLVPNGPADNTKQLSPTDRIIGVAQDGGEMVNVIGWRLDDVVELIRGPKGSKVILDVIPKDSANEASIQVAITRNRVMLEDQAANKRVIEVASQLGSYKIGVIDIPTFYADFEGYQAGDPNYKSTTRDVRKLLEELKQEEVDGVIVDLRNNGGGALNEANALVGLFIPTGATVQVRYSQGRVSVLNDSDPDVAYDGPLAVMINRLSASASEIFAGAIQDYQRGLLIGGQTFGKGTVQALLPLKRGQLKVTQAKFYRISGDSTQHLGVLPDIALPPLVDVTEIGEDALKEALPWDSIRPVLYKKSGAISPYIARLNTLHAERVKTNPDYQFRLAQLEQIKANREKTTLSLNLETRRQELEDNKARQLALENQRRQAKGEELLAALEETDPEEEALLEEGSETAADSDEELDPYLVESGHILADYIALSTTEITKTGEQYADQRLAAEKAENL